MENFLVGIVSGFVASACFLWFLYNLRPKIEISSHIARDRRPDGTVEYGFKFLNRTRYPIIDVKTRVRIRTGENVGGGTIWSVQNLSAGDIWTVPQYDKVDEEKKYAQRMAKPIDLDAKWHDGNSHVEFIVMAKHSLSGFVTVTSKKYYTKRDAIRDGTHRYGDDLTVG